MNRLTLHEFPNRNLALSVWNNFAIVALLLQAELHHLYMRAVVSHVACIFVHGSVFNSRCYPEREKGVETCRSASKIVLLEAHARVS